ncbi:MAG: hypothetical protein JWN20_1264 [Jatrophihabitantaceae bacterium]|nr:hypothetical protein [Jatrophihabitantaceae bacterium]
MSVPEGIPGVAPRGIVHRPLIQWIDALLDASPWSPSPGSPAAAVSVSGTGVLGGQCLAIALDAAGPHGAWRVADAVDLLGRNVIVAFQHDDPNRSAGIALSAGSSVDDRFVWRIPPDPMGRPPAFTAQEWAIVGLSFADAEVVGAPDRRALTHWEFAATATEGEPITVRLGGIGFAPQPSQFPSGVISLTFDDSFASQYSIAYPAMTATGLRGTLVPIIGRLDQPDYLTSVQVAAMATAGWEISGHATTDESHKLSLHRMTPEQRFVELAQIRDWNAAHGYDTDTFAYPGGWFDAPAAADVMRFFAAARSANGALVETWPTTQPDRIRTIVVKAATHPTLDEFLAHIEDARAHRAWIVFTFHGFSEGEDRGPYDILGDVFRGFCAALAASDVAVLPMREALAGRAVY